MNSVLLLPCHVSIFLLPRFHVAHATSAVETTCLEYQNITGYLNNTSPAYINSSATSNDSSSIAGTANASSPHPVPAKKTSSPYTDWPELPAWLADRVSPIVKNVVTAAVMWPLLIVGTFFIVIALVAPYVIYDWFRRYLLRWNKSSGGIPELSEESASSHDP